MWLQQRFLFLSLLTVLLVGEHSLATEPNETFSQATVLGAGVLSVSDNLTSGTIQAPDTYLGTLGFFGNVEFVDDDSSEYGNGFASGLNGVPINPGGTIDFLVTGCCDTSFTGNHFYSGDYDVIIEVFDFFGDPVDNFSETRTMVPGVVEQFNYFGDETWLDGSYNINIDNLIGDPVGGDLDFYTFTGLDVGSTFSAEITQDFPDGFDSILGWFDDSGSLFEFDDDDGEGVLSLIEGIVPPSGRLTFAVTGYDDFDFVGAHDYDTAYTLELSIEDMGVSGDFDDDGDVDGRDFLRWQRGNSPSPLSAVDLLDWRSNYGTGGLVSLAAVPEPTSLTLLVAVGCGLAARRLARHC